MIGYIASGFGSFDILIAAALLPAAIMSGSAHAETPVGNKYVFQTIAHDQATTIFTNTQNKNGIHLRSVVLTCGQNSDLFAITPHNKAVRIAFCAYTSNFGSSQFYGVLLPAGWGLEYAFGSDNGDPNMNEIAITYDLK